MKKTLYSLLAVMAALTLSCQKPVETEVALEKESNLRTFKAIFPSNPVDSKVYLHEDGKTGWEIGDVITIHGKYTDQLKTITLDGVTNTISADKKTATFTVALDMTADDYGTDGYYAAYPHSAYAEYEPNKARYFNCFDNTNQLLLSGVYNGSDAFVFYNVTGALSFIVDGSSFGGFDEYMIVGNNNEIIGYSHFNTRVATGNISFYHYSTTGPQKTISATVEDDGTTPNYVFFPATEASDGATELATCADFTKGFVIYFLKEGVITHMVSTDSHVRIGRQDLLPLGDITSHVKPYTPPTKHDSSIDMEGATALDASGNANCYIVDGSDDDNASKVFTFKAYKGNSTTGVGTVASAEILWETWNNAETVTANSVIAAVDFDKQDEDYYTIVFKMPATLHAGNALIAAKDTGGNILWSWHIWVPETTVTANENHGLFTRNIMDRNLGALVPAVATSSPISIQSLGLYYQWGRKDPFMAAKDFGSSSGATVAGTAMTKASGQITLAYSIAHPTVYGIYDSGTSNNDWLTPSTNDLWGNNTNTKTIYDPCPPGYKVPARNDSETFYHTKLVDGSTHATGWAIDVTNHWFTAGDPVAVFPLAGKITKSGSYDGHAKDRAHIWTSKKADDDASGCAQYIYIESETPKSAYSWNQEKAIGGSIRCIAEAAAE